jgi:hypothetical protein
VLARLLTMRSKPRRHLKVSIITARLTGVV